MNDIDKKIAKKRKISAIVVSLVIVAVLVSVALLSRRATKEISEYKIKNENVYMFFEDERVDYKTEIVLNRGNNVTNLLFDGQEIELYNEPIFINEKDEVILSTDMSIVFPLEGVKQRKASYFSRLALTDDGVCLMDGDNCGFNLSKSFLFDGNDLYFFNENVTIIIDDQEISLSPFSYVLCQYSGEIFVFDYSTKSVTTYENKNNNVIATDGFYVVNLCYDSVKFNDDSVLLFKKVKDLNVLK